MQRPDLLSLANPLAALRQRDALDFARQLGGEFVHADAHQARTLAQRPGVAGMEAQLLRNLEATDQAGRQSGWRLPFCGLQRGLNDDLVAAVKVIDQQEGHESQENQ